MKKYMLLSIIVSISTVIFCMSASALVGKSGPYSYEVKKNGDLKITAFDWNAYGNEDVYIPKMIDGYSVTEIGDSAFAKGKSKAVAIIIPDTIISIGDKAFFETQITSMHIPSSVLSIGEAAFAGCGKIRQFSVDSSNNRYAQIDGVLYNKIDRELIAYPPAKSENLVIPKGITAIAPYAFYKCETKIISTPSTLERIGAHAFDSSKIRGMNSEKDICVTYVVYIGEGAFSNCRSAYSGGYFNNIDLRASQITDIPNDCFRCVRLYDHDDNGIYLPSSLISIGDNAFSECGEITFLEIPLSVQTIGKSAFSGGGTIGMRISYLSFEENSSLKKIDDNAFKETSFYSFQNLPEGIEIIGEGALLYSYGPRELILPASIKSIGNNFCDRSKVNIVAEEGTYAYFWAVENGYTLTRHDDTSWLDGTEDEEQNDRSWLN